MDIKGREVNKSILRLFLREAFLFFLTLILGILASFKINNIAKVQKIEIPKISLENFILNFLFITLFFLLLIQFLKLKKEKGIILKGIFIFSVFFGGVLFFSIWLPDIVSLFLMVILVFWWIKKPSVLIHDILIVLGIAGTGSILGQSFTPEIVIIILIIFSIYDFIAVYKTKHMVKMAKEMLESKAILAMIVPPNNSSFKTNLREVQAGGDFLVLGGGDIAFPLIFCSSLVSFGILKVFVVAIFSLIGLFLGFYFFANQKIRKPIPALPPIAFFSIFGYLIIKFL